MGKQPHIVLGVTGSIAAFKAVELVRMIMARGWDVSVMMTEAATKYIGPLTFQALTRHPVAVGRFENLSADSFQHIDLADIASVLVIAPCTANVMAKIACGIADDVVTSTVVASDVALIVAPAMNTRMWTHPATRANRETLLARGVNVLAVGEGELACGTVGAGRLCELETIVQSIEAALRS